MVNTIEKTCGRCGKIFTVENNRRQRNYCSIQCANMGRGQPPGTPWTPERLKAITERYEHEPAAAIAADMGMTKGQIVGAMNRRGITKREPPELEEPKTMAFPSSGRCMWPLGHPHEKDFTFCGGRSLDGRPYCAEHCAMAYIRGA